MKYLTLLSIVFSSLLYSCRKDTLADRFVGDYVCHVTRTYWYRWDSCRPYTRRIADTDVIYSIRKYGEDGLLMRVPIHDGVQRELYDTIHSLSDYPYKYDDNSGFWMNPNATGTHLSVIKSNDTIHITQEDGHACTQPIYIYLYVGVRK